MESTLEMIHGSNAIEKAMRSINSQQSLMEKALGYTKGTSVIEQAMKSFESQNSIIERALSLSKGSSAIEQAIKSFYSQQALMKNVLGFSKTNSVIEQAMKAFDLQNSVMERALGFSHAASAIEKAMRSFESQQGVTDRAMAAMANSSSIYSSLTQLQNSNVLREINSTFLNQVAHSIQESSSINTSMLDEETLENEFQSATAMLTDSENSKSFFEIFNNLPPLIKLVLATFFLHVFLPQINSISANLITPTVESYLSGSDRTDREKVKDISVLPRKIEGIDTSGLRFITGNNVRLRADGSTNSEILDEMVFGQVVTVHSKNKNWIEISYKYEDGTEMHGWVFTRYTSRFVNQ